VRIGSWVKSLRLVAVDPRDFKHRRIGYQLISCGGDVTFLRVGSRRALDECRRALSDWRARQIATRAYRIEMNEPMIVKGA